MGFSHYDATITRSYISSRTAAGVSVMDHAVAVNEGRAENEAHPTLDMRIPNRAGRIIRESLDSEAHPNSLPIAVCLDTTGSMSTIPSKVVLQLPKLMDLLIKAKYVSDPHILFGAVNDATTYPAAALEVGQFESGNQMDGCLTNILVSQGGGGGTQCESYELIMFVLARLTELDSLKKRNKKGYCFILGDEKPYSFVSKLEVKEWIGIDIEADIPTTTILEELKQKFNVYWLFPSNAQNSRDRGVKAHLQGLFGQNLIMLKDEETICTTIAATIAINEGRDPRTVTEELKDGFKDNPDDIQVIIDSIPPRRFDDL